MAFMSRLGFKVSRVEVMASNYNGVYDEVVGLVEVVDEWSELWCMEKVTDENDH